MRRSVVAIVIGLALVGCGKQDERNGSGVGKAEGAAKPDLSGPCPALTVVADGVPVEGLVHGRAVTMISGSYTTHMVTLFNHGQSTCEEAVSGRRSIHEGEIAVKAFHGAMPGVGIDAYTHVEGTLTLDKPTDKVGEPMQICVRAPVEFTPNAGAYAGRKVSIVGAFAANFCGVNKQD